MAGFHLPFQPVRSSLYSPLELLEGFDPEDPHSFAETTDFLTYRYYRHSVKDASKRYMNGMLEAMHDNSMTQSMDAFLAGKPCMAIMGGHAVSRDQPSYRGVARLARTLALQDFVVATGGGPGIMEASHLGALMKNCPEEEVEAAMAKLSAHAIMPAGLRDILDRDARPMMRVVVQAHAWAKPAIDIVKGVQNPGESLAVPTWLYGHEPFTPFATHIAKYFQNSIREEGLLAVASNGIVFAEGSAGTLQEVFQDANQNHYEVFGWFSPMVFLGLQHWVAKFPVENILRPLFGDARFDKYVCITDSVDEAADFILAFRPECG